LHVNVEDVVNCLKLKYPEAAGIAVAYQNEPMKGGERRKRDILVSWIRMIGVHNTSYNPRIL
jgi:hypothetical protein